MLQTVLIRPGQTFYDEQERIAGNLDLPLSPAGQDQIRQLAVKLQEQTWTAIYCGNQTACVESANLLAKPLRAKVYKCEQFANMNLGLWQGMLIDDIRHKQPKVYKQWQEHPESVCPPQGEVITTAAKRLEAGLEKIAKKHSQGRVAIIVAEPLASWFAAQLDPGGEFDFWKVFEQAATTTELELHAKTWRTEMNFTVSSAN
ncbi:MAG: histidine phosphatase family protein [Pirellulales bacterium]|nr:histidine phosphatase family protein [Pirellulales bacterium]